MDDTLRYFFSAVFQGFAALITLGAMFFLYFFDKNDNKKFEIETKLKQLIEPTGGEKKSYIERHGIVKYAEEKFLPIKNDKYKNYHLIATLLEENRKILNNENKIKQDIPSLLKISFLSLFISLISLFLSGYHHIINYLLFLIGLFVIYNSIRFFLKLKNLIWSVINQKINS